MVAASPTLHISRLEKHVGDVGITRSRGMRLVEVLHRYIHGHFAKVPNADILSVNPYLNGGWLHIVAVNDGVQEKFAECLFWKKESHK